MEKDRYPDAVKTVLPCCDKMDIKVDRIPGDTFYECQNCGQVYDNFGILVEGKHKRA